ncbi:MAG: hypothetical protein QOJ11_440 [Frankiales bacterium]|jgi:predicted nucleotidyltransferase|nr:hypothetical protein [Frankiales bacterium]
MDMSRPISAVIPSLDGEVLSVLAGTTAPMTGRQIHRLARRGSQSGVNNVLVRLDRQGLVDVVHGGSANLYSLNRDHVAAAAVTDLADMRRVLFDRFRQAMSGWSRPPMAAAIFGSVARGDGDSDSDIDLILVRPDDVEEEEPAWSAAVEQLSRQGRRWSGNAVSVIQVDALQVADMVARGEPIVERLRAESISLLGMPVLDAAAVSA